MNLLLETGSLNQDNRLYSFATRQLESNAAIRLPVLLTLVGAWGAVTAALVSVLIYRSALATHEDTQVFLDPAERVLANEQREVGAKIDRLSRPINILLILSGVLLAATFCVWYAQKFHTF